MQTKHLVNHSLCVIAERSTCWGTRALSGRLLMSVVIGGSILPIKSSCMGFYGVVYALCETSILIAFS
jgi:hypothetical protein